MRALHNSIDWLKAFVTTVLVLELGGMFLLAPLEVHAEQLGEVNRVEVIAPKKLDTVIVRSAIEERKYTIPKPPVVPAPFVSAEAAQAVKKNTERYKNEGKKSEKSFTIASNTKPTKTVTHALSGKSRHVTATAYSSTVDQTDASPCTTANGYNVCKAGAENVIAANFLPFGAKVRIPDMFGDKVFVVQDRMHPRFSNRIDIWMRSRSSALQFGKRSVRIEIL